MDGIEAWWIVDFEVLEVGSGRDDESLRIPSRSEMVEEKRKDGVNTSIRGRRRKVQIPAA